MRSNIAEKGLIWLVSIGSGLLGVYVFQYLAGGPLKSLIQEATTGNFAQPLWVFNVFAFLLGFVIPHLILEALGR